jgi:hypothetical protein
MDWPGREQPKRPKPRLANGRRKYWALRIIDKKEDDVEITTRVEEKDTAEQHDEKEDIVPDIPAPTNAGRRISPRNHVSTRVGNAPVAPPPQGRRPRIRTIKETKRVVFYKIEWEGYGVEDATWKTEEEVVDEGLEWMIRDYEMRIHQQGDELDLGMACVFSPVLEAGKTRLRCGCS